MTSLFAALWPILADFLSTLVFVAIYAVTGSARAGIVLGIVAGVGQIAFVLFARKPIAAMQWMSLGRIIVLGGAALVTADPRFVMVKPSIGFFAVGLIMLKKGWMARYMRRIVTDNIDPVAPVLWGYDWSALVFVFSAANLAFAFLTGPSVWA